MKVAIVSRTIMHRGSNRRCVGGLVEEGGGLRSVRLMDARSGLGSDYWDDRVPFQIGDVWDLDITFDPHASPPQIENALVSALPETPLNRLGPQKLADWLIADSNAKLKSISPNCLWSGGPWHLFGDTQIHYTTNNSCYISADEPPAVSTGFWFPNQDLTLSIQDDKPYFCFPSRYDYGDPRFPYVGERPTVQTLPRRSLLRVSLARELEGRHYLMLSGWYF